jgi:hypothetical protein
LILFGIAAVATYLLLLAFDGEAHAAGRHHGTTNGSGAGIVGGLVNEVTDGLGNTDRRVLETVVDTTRPVLEATEPVLTPVLDTAEPVLTPVLDTAEPVLTPVLAPVRGTLRPPSGNAVPPPSGNAVPPTPGNGIPASVVRVPPESGADAAPAPPALTGVDPDSARGAVAAGGRRAGHPAFQAPAGTGRGPGAPPVPSGHTALLTVQTGGTSIGDPSPYPLWLQDGWQPYLHRLDPATGTSPVLSGRAAGEPPPPG